MLEPLPMKYAGFWKRFNAYGVDATLVLVLTFVISSFLGSSATAQSPSDMQTLTNALNALQGGGLDPALQQTAQEGLIRSLLGGSFFPGGDEYLAIIISALYNILFVAGPWQATPGKRWCRIHVVMADGRKLTLLESAIRHCVSGISIMACGLGYITMFFTPEKAALHDIICKTRVIMGRIGQEIVAN